MPQLFVHMPGDVESWGLVELQGQLETRDQIPLDNMHIGDLHFNSKGTPQLIVGHHLLTGKVVELERPYAILKKRTRGEHRDGIEGTMKMDLGSGDSNLEGRADEVEEDIASCTEYVVMALITKKIIFKNRPKPIITKTLAKK